MNAKLEHGQSKIEFPGKPSVKVRDTLKRYGYRWSPSGGYWWCKCDASKHHAAVADVEVAETGNNGTCEKCKKAPGILRQLGWNEPQMVLCTECCKVKNWHHMPTNEDYPCSDLGYEDQCRQACGL